MGCPKITYYQEGEGLEKATVIFFGHKNQKRGQQIFCLNYYPFGLTFNSYTSGTENLYKYTGMEEQKETGWYDYIARQYDPALGRFTSIDPLSEQMRRFSPYNYAFNNPVRFTDPDGMAPEDVVEEDGGLKPYSTESRTITNTYSGGPMSKSTNTITEVHSKSSGGFQKDGDGNRVWVESQSTTTTTSVLDKYGEVISDSQSTTSSSSTYSVGEGLQGSWTGMDKVDVKGELLSSSPAATTASETFSPSNEFTQLVGASVEYLKDNPGSSINFQAADYFAGLKSSNPAYDSQFNAGTAVASTVSMLFSSNTQTYYHSCGAGGVSNRPSLDKIPRK